MAANIINGDRQPNGRERTRQEICVTHLSDLARRLGPGAQLPTFAQLRTTLNVSGTTLIGALDDLEAKGILVRRHGVGIFVARDVNLKNIALITAPQYFYSDDNASPFWQQFVQLAWRRANASGMHFSLHFVTMDEHDKAVSSDGAPASLGDILIADLRQGILHGVLGVGLSTCARLWLTKLRIPLVGFAGYAPYGVMLDEALGAQLAVRTLAAQGCRRIALWTSSARDSAVREAYQQTLAMMGLPFDSRLIDGGDETTTAVSSLQRGAEIARAVFGPNSDPSVRPDGIYCAEDTLTRGAIPILWRLGIQVGLDLPFATQANTGSPLLFGLDDYLIRIENDPARIVEEMYRLLVGQMEGRSTVEERILLPPSVRIPQHLQKPMAGTPPRP